MQWFGALLMSNDFAKTEIQILATNFGDAEKQWIFIPMF